MGIIKTGKIQSHGDIVDLTTRIAVLEDKYVKALWYAEISSGTSGTITPPTNGTIVLNEFGNDVDAVTSTIVTTKKPDFISAKTSAGAIVTATLAANGAWTISGAPSAYPIAIVYVYEVKLVNFDHDSALYEEEISQGTQPTDSPAFTGITLSGNLTVPAEGYIKPAASGPKILFGVTPSAVLQITLADVAIGTTTVDANTALQVQDNAFHLSSASLAHSMTNITAARTYGYFTKAGGASSGGLSIAGFTAVGTIAAIDFVGCLGSANPTDTIPAIQFRAFKSDGSTSITELGDAETCFQFTNGGNTAKGFTVLGNGNVGLNDVAPGELLDVAGNINATGVLKIDDVQVVSNQGAAVADATDAATAITQLNTLLARVRVHGLIASA